MIHPTKVLLAASIVFGVASSGLAQDKSTSLFNGKDLSGWSTYLRPNKDGSTPDPKNTWSIVDGYIRCTGKPPGYIATTQQFGDYELRLKWRFPANSKGGNSGVLLHVQEEDKVWPDSVEAQLAAGSAGDFWIIMPPKVTLNVDKTRQDPRQARHYFRLLKDEAVEKPFGEWNQYVITCRGGDVKLVINDKFVNEGTGGNLTKGRIALQSEGAEVHFKDIELTPMK